MSLCSLVLHGKSLSTNITSSSSPKWLDSYKIPKLSIDKRELTAKQINKNLGEPLRIYRAIQILFPEYDTVATFFFKTFSC